MLQTLSVDLYYWMACMESASGRRVISKFGLNNDESQIFFLAPTSGRPVLVERFSGQTLANINMGDIEDCIQQGQLALLNLKKKCNKKEDQTTKMDMELREVRGQRVLPEDKEGITIILRYGSTRLKRKFKATALFQEVYDWAGSQQNVPLNFTLQRQKHVVKHQDPLLGKEVLDICERDPEEAKALLDDQVCFKGNVPLGKQEILQTTVEDEDHQDHYKKERRMEKRRKKERKEKREKKKQKSEEKKDARVDKDGECRREDASMEGEEGEKVEKEEIKEINAKGEKKKREKRTGCQRKKLKK
nr:uncharacterized protein LOC131797277 [Pocillopora verrucosa]